MNPVDRLLIQALPSTPTLLTARQLARTTQLPVALVRHALPRLITLCCLDQVDRGVYCSTGLAKRVLQDLMAGDE